MRGLFTTVCLLTIACLAGCGGSESPEQDAAPAEEIKRATAWINPKSGSSVTGSAIFINEGTQVALQVSIEYAPPGTELACHLHEIGDCSAEDGTSAGGHWNPTGHDHGKWGSDPYHLGDVGNIKIGEDGKGSLSLSTDRWKMGGGSDNDVMGKAIIIHAGPDDFETQPTGAAGGRIGCGVIKAG